MKWIDKLRRIIACRLVRQQRNIDFSEPMFSFSFDDAPNSAFVTAREILKKYGYAGTYYISLGLFKDDQPDIAYFDREHLRKVIDEGGELGCHTYNHIHFYSATEDEIGSDLDENQDQLRQIIPDYLFSNFSYPYGEQTIRSKMLIRSRFSSARSVKTGINRNPVDLNNLKSMQLDQELTLDTAIAFIEKTIRQKGWLIFYTHDVQDDCSPLGYKPAYFESIVKYCFDRKLRVVTIEKGVDLINASS